MQGCSACLHCAGVVDTRSGPLHDARIHHSHVDGTAAVIEACKHAGVESLVYISSASAAADGVFADDGDDERAVRGSGTACAYGLAKREAERLVVGAHGSSLSTVCVRPQMIIGPGDPLVTEDLLSAPFPPPIIGRGTNTHTPTYVRNLAGLLALLPSRLRDERSRRST